MGTNQASGKLMQHSQDRQVPISRLDRSVFGLDTPLVVFLLAGWILIFATATFGVRREVQRWVPAHLVSAVSANYGVDTAEVPRLARVNPRIIEAIKQDAQYIQPVQVKPPLTVLPPPVPVSLPAVPTAVPAPGDFRVSSGGPYQGNEGSPIVLTALHDNLMPNLLPGSVTYQWDFDHDGRYNDATGNPVSVIFYDEGEYSVGVQATDTRGRVDTNTAMVLVNNVAPRVSLKESKALTEGEPGSFSAVTSDPGNDVLVYEWDFGDGTLPVVGPLNPSHTYPDNGPYTVRVQVNDNDGGISTATLTAHVRNAPPVVDAGPDQQVNEGSQVTFNGTATDPGKLDRLTYAWDFDYDGQTFTPDASGPSASTVYYHGPATPVAALRVRDNNGGETIDTINIRVGNVDPIVTAITAQSPTAEGSPFNISIAATDPGNDALRYAFDWQNDGSFDVVGLSDSATYTWPNEGDYTVRIRVDDQKGGQVFTTTTVSAFNVAPTAIAANSVTSRFEGSPVTFDGSSSSDPGKNDLLTYLWDFGDGNTGSTAKVDHSYDDNDVYTATLTVTDDSNAVSTVAVPVTILNANPKANAGPDLVVEESRTDKLQLSFKGTAQDPGLADTLAYAWDLDSDGTFETIGPAVDHLYQNLDGPTELAVTLRVRDDDYQSSPQDGSDSGEAVDTLKVTVKNVPPLTEAGGPYFGTEKRPLTLTGSASDMPLDFITYAWDLDNDDSCETPGRVISHTWAVAGVYTVKLCARDDDGGESSDTAQVSINGIPIAAAVVSPTTGLEGGAITFDASNSVDPDGDSLSYQWDFDDGEQASGPIVTHIYTDNRVYTPTLTVQDSHGDTNTYVPGSITVLNANPSPDIGPDQTASEGLPLTLKAQAADPGQADTLTYAWDFDYDGHTFDVDASGASVSNTYPDGLQSPRPITVAVRVRDDDYPVPSDQGEIGEAFDTMQVTVQNLPPHDVDPGGPYVTTANVPVTLRGQAADVAADPLAFAWDFDYDGSFNTAATGAEVETAWPEAGTYTIALQVSDDDGGVSLATTTVDVGRPPLAVAGGPYAGDEGSQVTLNGDASSDPDGDPLTYTWSFGDGGSPASGVTVNHTYANTGIYTVTLQVEDGRGGTAVANTAVTVNNVPPTAAVTAGPDPAQEGDTVSFDGRASTAGPADTLSYTWDYGDGQADTGGPSVTHVYEDNGVYTTTLTVTDDDGTTATMAVAIAVVNVNPVADAGGPYSATVGQPVTLTGSGSDVPADPLSFSWDLDGDGSPETSGQEVEHTWDTAGTYEVTLTVADDDGGQASAQTTVEVNGPPIAAATGPYQGIENDPVTLTGSGTDPDNDPLTYSWDLDDDGTFETSGSTITHSWPDNGVFPITLRIEDNHGNITTSQAQVTINNQPPTADAGGPYSATVGQPVTLTGSGSDVPADPLSFSWDLDGDGSPETSGQEVEHTWDTAGTYEVTLTVADDDGGQASAQTTVEVKEP